MKRSSRSPARESVLSAGTSLLAMNPGASMIEIAQYAGVGRASLHRHFTNREELIHEITVRALDSVVDVLEGVMDSKISNGERLVAFAEKLVPLGDSLHFMIYEWKSLTSPELIQRYMAHEQAVFGLIEAAKSDGVVSASLSARWVYYLIDTVVFTAWYAIQDGTIASRDAPKLASTALTAGVLGSDT